MKDVFKYNITFDRITYQDHFPVTFEQFKDKLSCFLKFCGLDYYIYILKANNNEEFIELIKNDATISRCIITYIIKSYIERVDYMYYNMNEYFENNIFYRNEQPFYVKILPVHIGIVFQLFDENNNVIETEYLLWKMWKILREKYTLNNSQKIPSLKSFKKQMMI